MRIRWIKVLIISNHLFVFTKKYKKLLTLIKTHNYTCVLIFQSFTGDDKWIEIKM